MSIASWPVCRPCRRYRVSTVSYSGKDTTYVLDFVNSSEAVLDAFRTYYETAHLDGVTDPELIFTLKDKLDHGGWYVTPEVERVIQVIALGPGHRKRSCRRHFNRWLNVW